MNKLKKRKYITSTLIVFLFLLIVVLVKVGRVDKFSGLVKVSNTNISSKLLSSVGHAVLNEEEVKGNTTIEYLVSFTLDQIDGVNTRDAIIKGSLSEEESRYARFKEITGNNITSTLTNNGKNIEVLVNDVELGVEKTIRLKLIIENAPNEYEIKPTISVKEVTGEYTYFNTDNIVVTTNSVEGIIKDTNKTPVSNIEVSIKKNNKEIKRTYTDEDGRYVLTDLDEGDYILDVEEEMYDLISNKNVHVSGKTTLDLKVKEVEPYKIEIHKYIKRIYLLVDGVEYKFTYDDKDKVVETIRKGNNISGEIEYKLVVKNTGEKEGVVTRVIDEPDEGLSLKEGLNNGWEEEDNAFYYRPIEEAVLKPNEEREIKLTLEIDKTDKLKEYLNKMTTKGEINEKVVFILDGEKYKEETLVEGEKLDKVIIDDPNFDGWYTDKNKTNKYNFNNPVTKDLILYGEIKKSECTVTFIDFDNIYTEEQVVCGERVNKPTNPTHDGYNFINWFDNDDVEFDEQAIVDYDTTFTSKYSLVEYNLSYQDLTNEEIASLNNPKKYTIESDNITLNNPSDRIDEDGDVYEAFTGWVGTDVLSPSTSVTITKGSTGNRTYSATFIEVLPDEYTITYDLDGGNLNPGVTNPSTYTKKDEFTLLNPSKVGYDFIGWIESEGETPVINKKIEKGTTGNKHFIAKYSLIRYNITYNLDGGTVSSTPTYTVETDTFTLPEPSKTGYTFIGWTGSNGNTPQKIVTITKGTTGDKTYTANYSINKYDVIFMDQDNQFALEKINYNEKATIPNPNPTKAHNIFKGWMLNNTLYDFNTPVTSSITLYSSYEEVTSPSITINPSTEWVKDKVLVTVSSNNNYTYMYKIGDGEYTSYTEPFYVTNNVAVYAYSVKDSIMSLEATTVISNIDNIDPTLTNLEVENATPISGTISFKGIDNESGLKNYKVYVNNELIYTSPNYTTVIDEKVEEYTITNLEELTDYNIKVEFYDNVGNYSYDNITLSTTAKTYVARIVNINNSELETPIRFETLKEAIEYNSCVSNSCIIEMLENVSESNDILEGQDITLDLNGKTITGVKNYTFNNNGSFTVIDNSENPGLIYNSIETAIENTGLFTIGELEDPLLVNNNKPVIEGNTYGIYSSSIFDYYDGKIIGLTAIKGKVSDTPYLYNVSIGMNSDNKQVSSLTKLATAEARNNSQYYTDIQRGFNESQNGTYEDVDYEKPLIEQTRSNDSYRFIYNQNDNTLKSNNKGVNSSIAHSYIKLDLTNYEEDQLLNINAKISSESSYDFGYAIISDSNAMPDINSAEGKFISVSGISEAHDYSVSLEKGSVYYLHLIYSKNGSNSKNDDTFTIYDINLGDYKTTYLSDLSNASLISNVNYGFVKGQDGSIISTNTGSSTVSNSFMIIDMTNINEAKRLNVNASISGTTYNYGYITVTNTASVPAYNSSTGRQVYINGVKVATDYTITLTPNQINYIHFGYRLGTITSGVDNYFKINSITVLDEEIPAYTDTNNERTKTITYETPRLNEEADTIQMIKDITRSTPLEITETRNVVLDLNGHTLTTSSEDYVINNNGELTIIDSKYENDEDRITTNYNRKASEFNTKMAYLQSEEHENYLSRKEAINSYTTSDYVSNDLVNINSLRENSVEKLTEKISTSRLVTKNNNQNKNSTSAHSYMLFDLTDETENKDITLSVSVSSEANYDIGFVILNNSPATVSYNDSNPKIISISGSQSKTETITLTAGELNYLHFGYRKDGGSHTADDSFYIDSIDYSSVTTETIPLEHNSSDTYYFETNREYNNTINNITYDSDKNGYAFNGSNSYFYLLKLDPENDISNYTLETTFELNQIKKQTIITNNSNFDLYVSSGGVLYLSLKSPSDSSFTGYTVLSSIETNKKYHVAIKSSNETIYIYVNNKLVKKLDSMNITLNKDDYIRLGTRSGALNGLIYTIRAYNKPLTDAELNKNYDIDNKFYEIEELEEKDVTKNNNLLFMDRYITLNKATNNTYTKSLENNELSIAISNYYSLNGDYYQSMYFTNSIDITDDNYIVSGDINIWNNGNDYQDSGDVYIGLVTELNNTTTIDDFVVYKKFDSLYKSSHTEKFYLNPEVPGKYYLKLLLYRNAGGGVYTKLKNVKVGYNIPTLDYEKSTYLNQTGIITSTTYSVINNRYDANLILDSGIVRTNKSGEYSGIINRGTLTLNEDSLIDAPLSNNIGIKNIDNGVIIGNNGTISTVSKGILMKGNTSNLSKLKIIMKDNDANGIYNENNAPLIISNIETSGAGNADIYNNTDKDIIVKQSNLNAKGYYTYYTNSTEGNSYDVTFENNSYIGSGIEDLRTNANLTIKNSNLNNSGSFYVSSGSKGTRAVSSQGTLVIDKSVIKSYTGLAISNTGIGSIKDSTILGTGAYIILSSNELNLNNVIINDNGGSTNVISNSKNMNLRDVTINTNGGNIISNSTSGNMSITGNFEINGSSNTFIENSGTMSILGNLEMKDSATTAIKNTGTITLGVNDNNVSDYPIIKATSKAITNTGTFNYYDGSLEGIIDDSIEGPISSVPDNHEIYVTKANPLEVITLRSYTDLASTNDYIASIGNNKYVTIQAAIDSVNDSNNTKIDILKDFYTATGINVPSNKNIIINYDNHKINSYLGDTYLVNNGTLKLTDETEEVTGFTRSYSPLVIENNGDLVFEKTTYNAYSNNSLLENNGNLTINSGKLHSRYSKAGTLSITNNSNIVQNGGTISQGQYSCDTRYGCNTDAYLLRNNENSTYELIDGIITKSSSGEVVTNYGTFNQSGGKINDSCSTFYGSSNSIINYNNLNITGGALNKNTSNYGPAIINRGPANISSYTINFNRGDAAISNVLGNMVLTDVTLNGVIATSNDSDLVINSGTYSGSSAFASINLSGSSTVNIKGGTFTSTALATSDITGYSCIYLSGSSSIDIENGTFTSKGPVIGLTGTSTATLRDGTYKSNNYSGIIHNGTGTLTIGTEGGTVDTAKPHIEGNTYGLNVTNQSAVVNFYDGELIGNTAINGNITDKEEGYEVLKDDTEREDGKERKYLGISPLIIINRGQETLKFFDVQSAITEAQNGETLLLNREYTQPATEETYIIPSGKNITFDTNGYKFLHNNSKLFENNGTLTITDGVRIDNDDTNSGIFTNSGTVVDNNGTLNITNAYLFTKTGLVVDNKDTLNITNSYINSEDSSPASLLITNTGTVNIDNSFLRSIKNNCPMEGCATESHIIDNLSVNSVLNITNSSKLQKNTKSYLIKNEGSTTIDDITLTNNCSYRLYYSNNCKSNSIENSGTLSITDSNFSSFHWNHIYNTGTATISDSSILGEIRGASNSTLTLTDVEGNEVYTFDSSEITIERGSYVSIETNGSSIININNTEITGNKSETITTNGTSTLNIDLGTYNGGVRLNGSSTLNLKRGTINYESSAVINVYSSNATLNIGADDGNINLNDITINGYITSEYGSNTNFYDGKIITSEPMENFKVNNIPSNTSIVEKTNDSKYETYVKDEKNIKIERNNDSLYFYNLSSAVNSSITGDKIVFLTKYFEPTSEGASTIDSNKNITIDFNGNIIVQTVNYFIVNNGILTIDDSGSTKGYVISKKSKIANNGTLTMKDGVFKSAGTCVNNTGTLIVDGGEYYANNYRTIENSGTATINGGTLNTIYSNITNSGTMIYNGGTLNVTADSSSQSGFENTGNLTINGGTFNINYSTVKLVDNSNITNLNNISVKRDINNTKTMNLNNVNVTNAAVINKGSNANLTIDGGIFNNTNDKYVLSLSNSSNTTIRNAIMTSKYNTIGVSNNTNISIISGTIKSSEGYAISSSGNVTIGTKGTPVVTNDPNIIGNSYGIANTGKLYFYDGIISGKTASRYGTVTEVEPGFKEDPFDNVIDDENYHSTILSVIGDDEIYAVVNGLNFGSLQLAINYAVNNNITDVTLYKSIVLDSDITKPEGINIDLYIGSNTIDYNGFTIDSGINIISNTSNNLSGSIYRLFASITNKEVNPKDIVIYEMEDGTALSDIDYYKLYKYEDNAYRTVMVNEEKLGDYTIGRKKEEMYTLRGKIYLNGIGEGTYKLVSSKGKELNFDIYEDGVSSNIRISTKTKKQKIETSLAILIINFSTGNIKIPYMPFVIITILSIITLIIMKRHVNKKEKAM